MENYKLREKVNGGQKENNEARISANIFIEEGEKMDRFYCLNGVNSHFIILILFGLEAFLFLL